MRRWSTTKEREEKSVEHLTHSRPMFLPKELPTPAHLSPLYTCLICIACQQTSSKWDLAVEANEGGDGGGYKKQGRLGWRGLCRCVTASRARISGCVKGLGRRWVGGHLTPCSYQSATNQIQSLTHLITCARFRIFFPNIFWWGECNRIFTFLIARQMTKTVYQKLIEKGLGSSMSLGLTLQHHRIIDDTEIICGIKDIVFEWHDFSAINLDQWQFEWRCGGGSATKHLLEIIGRIGSYNIRQLIYVNIVCNIKETLQVIVLATS